MSIQTENENHLAHKLERIRSEVNNFSKSWKVVTFKGEMLFNLSWFIKLDHGEI